MGVGQYPDVAVLLATYNGARFIEAQLRSLAENGTPFTVHWLDDHSTDNTCEVVRAAALNAKLSIREWHQKKHQGVPATFFRLLECADADLYMFCDQDDVWQPGKIDAAVKNLLPDLHRPVLCFSDPLVFFNEKPGELCWLTQKLGVKHRSTKQAVRLFTGNIAAGHTMAFTRPLRQIVLRDIEIACEYALMHDWWMHLIAVASGSARMLIDAPTTLYRLHDSNRLGVYLKPARRYVRDRLVQRWRETQAARRSLARNAHGFTRAAARLPYGPQLESLLTVARIVEKLDLRQSPIQLIRLAFSGAFWPVLGHTSWLVITCLCSHAHAEPDVHTAGVDEAV